MKTLSKLFFISLSIIFLCSCKTQPSLYRAYPNTKIDSLTKEDTSITKKIDPYKSQIDSIMQQKITFAEKDFTKEGYSSNEGNLLADLVLNYAKNYAKENGQPQPDFCLLNIGGVRTIIPQGVVTIGTIFEVAPFENEVVLVELDETLMNELFQYIGEEKKGHPLAGIQIKYSKNKSYEAKINNLPFNPKKKYWVATIEYLMNGGDRMYFLTKSPHKIVTKSKLREVFIKEMRQYEVLPESKDERLKFED